MVLLIASLHVMPPITLGRFQNRDECEQERITVWERLVDEAVRGDFIIICIGPDMQVEKKRFEFRARP
jgi:hypothetical protein